jgi:zinc transporter ZupT
MEDFIVYISLILSVVTGGVIVLYFGKSNDKLLKLLLSFSGAFLLGISFMHLVPEIYAAGVPNIGVYVLIGFLFQLLLEFFSEGIEHGHMHIHHDHDHSHRKFPMVVMISLCIHAFVEGIPIEREIHAVHTDDFHNHESHSLLLGVIFHNIPVSIALMSMFIHSGLKNTQSFLWLMVFALMGPLGTFTGHFLSSEIEIYMQDFLDIILAVVVGMFLHISTTILFESAEGHRFNVIKLVSILAGVGMAMVN